MGAQLRVSWLEDAIQLQTNESRRLMAVYNELLKFKHAQIDASKDRHGAIAVLVIACNRPKATKNHLDQLLKQRPSATKFPIVVSQDCAHAPTAAVLESYANRITVVRQPDQQEISDIPFDHLKWSSYYKISRHYKWALNYTFTTANYDAVLITEDDLDIAPDFFDYFEATLPILKQDPSLWCVAAWNDNGKAELIDANKPDLLHRTDFFPGLGWMLTKELWNELSPKWPRAFWDDWMRESMQRKDRACIRPEISRTSMSTFGKQGASSGLWFDSHLRFIRLNAAAVPFTRTDLSYLLKEKYDRTFADDVYGCAEIKQSELQNEKLQNGTSLPKAARILYTNPDEYHTITKTFGLMEDLRSGVPRTAYRGVVSFMYKQTRVYIAPPRSWTGYDSSWN